MALLLAGAPAAAAPLDWLQGLWSGSGSIFGRASEARLEAGPALGGRFVELRYAVTAAGDPPFAFEGRAFYRPDEAGAWRAHWFDSRGLVLPISASVDGETLTSDWGGGGTERGRTRYRRLPNGRLEVTDWVLGPDGGWREFASHRLEPVH